MSFWNRKKPQPEKPPEPKAPGLFSTEFAPRAARDELAAFAIQQNFPRRLPQMAGVATDSADQTGLKQAFSSNWGGIPDAQIAWFASLGFIGWQLCALLSQHWLVDKCCTIPARDAVRVGFDITITDGTDVPPEKLDALRACDAKYKLKDQLQEYIRKGKIFGMRIALCKIESSDPNYYEKPFNPDGIRPNTYRGIVQIDPIWITPVIDNLSLFDPASPDYYEPTYWQINGKKYHKSHLVIFRNCEVTDLNKPQYFYGGISLPQKIAERVYGAERTANEAPMLALTKRLTTLSMDLTQAAVNQEAFEEKLAYRSELQNNFATTVIGTGETMTQHDITLTDLDSVILTQYTIVAAIAEIPVTKLMGTSAKGLNATGEGDEANYHETLESLQEHDLNPLIARHHLCCIRSDVSPGKPFETGVKWNELDSPTSKEVAEVNKLKAETAGLHIDNGSIDSIDERNRLAADPDSGYNFPTVEDDEELEDGDNTSTIGTPTNKTLAQISLNGPQILAISEILTQIVSKEIPPESAKALLKTAFPLSDDDIDAMVDPLANFEPPPPPAPVIAPGAPNAPPQKPNTPPGNGNPVA